MAAKFKRGELVRCVAKSEDPNAGIVPPVMAVVWHRPPYIACREETQSDGEASVLLRFRDEDVARLPDKSLMRARERALAHREAP